MKNAFVNLKAPASGIFNKAANARNADRFSSSFFSYSCLTALLRTF